MPVSSRLSSYESDMREIINRIKGEEKEWLADFMVTGIPGGLNIQLDTNANLICFGEHWGEGGQLFAIDRRKVIASKRRATHVMSMLKKLAAREGLKFEAVSEPPCGTGLLRVACWRWKEVREVDDEALVSKTQARKFEEEYPEVADIGVGSVTMDEAMDIPMEAFQRMQEQMRPRRPMQYRTVSMTNTLGTNVLWDMNGATWRTIDNPF